MSVILNAKIEKLPRHFFPADFKVTTWEMLEPYFKNLLERSIQSKADLEQWLKDISETEAIISEDACWRQIKMTVDTTDKQAEEAFTYFCMEIQPKIQPYIFQLNKKFIESPYTKELEQEKYFCYIRNVKKNIDIFREENIPLLAELNVMQQQYAVIAGKMTVEINGKEYTLQQASKFLESPDRSLRELAYKKINERRMADKEALHELYSSLIEKRTRVAKNAGFANYRDYKFIEMGRFDYTKEDCFQFHEAVKQHVLPLVNAIYEHKKEILQVDTLRPWDVEAVPPNEEPLHPFETGKELLEKTIQCMQQLHPFFAGCLRTMEALGHLDLESRKGKAPGGYNCPLAESGAPFIFMNASGQMDDVTTMVHETGHAVQSFLTHHLELTAFKEYPTEIAEVASMSMELFTMPYWNVFFADEASLKRAHQHQLERVITIFPWIAMIDKFQHWIYEHPQHSIEERTKSWESIVAEFSSPVINYSGLEAYRAISWQKQLHLYEVPFYYIEYGIAQLGAIGLWMQFKESKEQALNNYIQALSIGGMQPLPKLYEAAGLQFSFAPNYIKQLMNFVNKEMKALM